MGKKIKHISVVKILIFMISMFIYFVSKFINVRFENMSFEQLLYNVSKTEGANYDILIEGASNIFFNMLIVIVIMKLVIDILKRSKIEICFKLGIGNKKFRFYPFKYSKLKSNLLLLLIFISCLYSSYDLLNIGKFIETQKKASTIFEEYYIDGKNVKLIFPEKKRNLIYIYLESMEMTNASIENGGIIEKTYIPKLEEIALKNINFSNSNKLGGAYQLNNTNWTIAAITAQTAGVPMKISLGQNEYHDFSDSLPGVYSLGDILYDNGYNNYFMIGSNANFGGRKDYFNKHGKYEIYDYEWAKKEKMIPDDYFEFWGYEDEKLFSYAKTKILEASKKDKPFNFTILTVDTHFSDGYLDDSCKITFDEQYENALYCSDSKVYSFIKWIEKQDFYDNTTIIIVGDHFTMQEKFYKIPDGYKRTIYNAFINSAVIPKKEKNREFSTLDLFPTTLAALDVKIEGEKLGLGVNLFSEEKTLIEKFGFDYVNNEIQKKSFYYDNNLLGNTYYEMKEVLEEEQG